MVVDFISEGIRSVFVGLGFVFFFDFYQLCLDNIEDPFYPICHYMDIQDFSFLIDRLDRQIGFDRFNIQIRMEAVIDKEKTESCSFRNLIIYGEFG